MIYKISAITLSVKNMEKSCKFYSRLPGFKVVYGGSYNDFFTIFEIGAASNTTNKMYLNLELKRNNGTTIHHNHNDKTDFGRIIFYTEDVDELYSQLKNDVSLSELVSFENEPINGSWGERFFHIRDPDGYQLSFAMPIERKSN